MAENKSEQVISEEPDKLEGKPGETEQEPSGRKLWLFGLSALGIVYGDIGTSPLYAFRNCFHGETAIAATRASVLGVLSLIFWSLWIVISAKYLAYVMRADNEGEGGVLALMALIAPRKQRRRMTILVAMGLFGAALIYGDGTITPAISVLSAVEGLEIATRAADPFILPITVIILFLLFVFQRRGTAGVGAVFGPVMLVWFLALAVLGLVGIVRQPAVLEAVLPTHAVRFFLDNRWQGFFTLGTVFLVVTGGEALYADIGHFGRSPIRLTWFSVVLPALLLNYFGQGALLLEDPARSVQPFYLLAPRWALYPLVGLAVAATIIASQAVISASFSLAHQAVQLGQFPHMRIVFTSGEKMGQIYMPTINWLLMAVTIGLVLGFRESTKLAGAYGIAVSTTMVITTLLAFVVARRRWNWALLPALLVTIGLLCVDLPFFGSNLLKIAQGGWFPLAVAALVFIIMTTWQKGHAILEKRVTGNVTPLDDYLDELEQAPPARVPGTAIFLTGHSEGTPTTLQRHVSHNHALQEQVVLVTVAIEDTPRVPTTQRLEATRLEQGFTRVIVHFGFMERPDVPRALRLARRFDLDIDPDDATYYVGRQTLVTGDKPRSMAAWRVRLYSFLSRNSAEPIAFYQLPPERVFETGIRVEL